VKWLYWILAMALVSGPFHACGPNAKPGPPCEGPTFSLVVKTEDCQPLPPDTRLNVRYGSNHEGEAYALGVKPTKQAVFCDELSTPPETCGAGGAAGTPVSMAGAAGGDAAPPINADVFALSCRLYTQGPARVDVTATGYEPIEEQDLTLDEKERCQVEREVELKLLMDAGL